MHHLNYRVRWVKLIPFLGKVHIIWFFMVIILEQLAQHEKIKWRSVFGFVLNQRHMQLRRKDDTRETDIQRNRGWRRFDRSVGHFRRGLAIFIEQRPRIGGRVCIFGWKFERLYVICWGEGRLET